MLRNRSERIATGPGAGLLVAGTNYVGLTGTQILAATGSGTHGAGIFSEWGVTPARRYRALVTSLTGGPLRLDENGAGEADATFSALLTIYEWDGATVSTFAGIPLTGSIAAIHTVALNFVEPADDTVSIGVSVTLPVSVSLAFTEPADDTVSIGATITRVITAAMSFVEPADDTVSIGVELSQQPQQPPVTVTLAYAEPTDDLVSIGATVLGSQVGGMLAALAAEYATMRAASGLFVGGTEVLTCAINATRKYAAYAVMTDPTARLGPFSITGSTTVTTGEWAIIAPLFRLYVERESAVVVEASRVAGLEMVGRSYAEVQADINQAEAELPQRSYVEDVWTVGIPAD